MIEHLLCNAILLHAPKTSQSYYNFSNYARKNAKIVQIFSFFLRFAQFPALFHQNYPSLPLFHLSFPIALPRKTASQVIRAAIFLAFTKRKRPFGRLQSFAVFLYVVQAQRDNLENNLHHYLFPILFFFSFHFQS